MSTPTIDSEVEIDCVLDQEFDALCLEVKADDAADSTAKPKKYPAKVHARKVATELNVDDGLIYLPGEPTRLFEDSDQGPTFRQRRYFYYITGADFADCAVTYEISQDHLILWIPYREPRQVLYFGPTPSAEEAKLRYDVDDVRYTCDLGRFLQRLLQPSTTLYVLHRGQAPRLDDGSYGRAMVDHSKLQPAMDAARVIKTAHELELIRRACIVSAAAHRRVASRFLSMRSEREVEAVFKAECIVRGGPNQAYPVIAGSGVNASTLHYIENNQALKGKELMVLDASCEWDNYASDITRTLPIRGTFEGRAAQIHTIVQRMQEECISKVRPGTLYASLHLRAAEVALEGLMRLGILRGDAGEMFAKGTVGAFFPHGLGHHVGLEVHDVSGPASLLSVPRNASATPCGKRVLVTKAMWLSWLEAEATRPYKGTQRLRPNMVFTIEPGIYFCREYIEGFFLNDPDQADYFNLELLEKYWEVGGVRIEDVILVTEDGYENLSKDAPKGSELLDVINGRQVEEDELE